MYVYYVFTLSIGSERFEYYVGELQFIHSTLFDSSSNSNNTRKKLQRHPKIRKFMQNQREVQIAMNIKESVQKYTDYHSYIMNKVNTNTTVNRDIHKVHELAQELYIEYIMKDIHDMSKTALGRALIRCIGEGILEALYTEQSQLHTSSNNNNNNNSNTIGGIKHTLWNNIYKIRMYGYQMYRYMEHKGIVIDSSVTSLIAWWNMNSIKRSARKRISDSSSTEDDDSSKSSSSSMDVVKALSTMNNTATTNSTRRSTSMNESSIDEDDEDDEEEEEKGLILSDTEKKQVNMYFNTIRDNM